jgi:hypothetical protein
VVAGIPKMVESVLQRRLRKNSIVLDLILDRPHLAGIDVEIFDLAAYGDAIVLIWMKRGSTGVDVTVSVLLAIAQVRHFVVIYNAGRLEDLYQRAWTLN